MRLGDETGTVRVENPPGVRVPRLDGKTMAGVRVSLDLPDGGRVIVGVEGGAGKCRSMVADKIGSGSGVVDDDSYCEKEALEKRAQVHVAGRKRMSPGRAIRPVSFHLETFATQLAGLSAFYKEDDRAT